MPRQYKTGRNNRTHYIYYTRDGERLVIRPGESGVTEADIELLHEMDDASVDAQRRYEYRVSARYDAFRTGDAEDDPDINPYLADPDANPENILQSKEDEQHYSQSLQALAKAMGALLPRQRVLLERVYVEKWTLTEIAKLEGVSEAAIRHRLQKLHARLKKVFLE